jgi:hypothetical protein
VGAVILVLILLVVFVAATASAEAQQERARRRRAGRASRGPVAPPPGVVEPAPASPKSGARALPDAATGRRGQPFLSYHHREVRHARAFRDAVAAAGGRLRIVEGWLGVSGPNLDHELQRAIRRSGGAIVVYSEAETLSHWVSTEVLHASRLGLLPILVSPGEPPATPWAGRANAYRLRHAEGLPPAGFLHVRLDELGRERAAGVVAASLVSLRWAMAKRIALWVASTALVTLSLRFFFPELHAAVLVCLAFVSVVFLALHLAGELDNDNAVRGRGGVRAVVERPRKGVPWTGFLALGLLLFPPLYGVIGVAGQRFLQRGRTRFRLNRATAAAIRAADADRD